MAVSIRAEKPPAPPPEPKQPEEKGVRQATVAVFILLFISGLILMFFPELANSLYARSSGGSIRPLAEETVTTETGTDLERNTSKSEEESKTTEKPKSEQNSKGKKSEQGRTAKESTKTTTVRTEPGRDLSILGLATASPGLIVLFRLGVLALLSFLVAGFIYRTGHRQFGIKLGVLDLGSVDVARNQLKAANETLLGGSPFLRDIVEQLSIATLSMQSNMGLKIADDVVVPAPTSMFIDDPNAALAAFRTELEQRLRVLASHKGISQTQDINSIIAELGETEILGAGGVTGLSDMLNIADSAVHGATVEPSVAQWVKGEGAQLLTALDIAAIEPSVKPAEE